MSLVTTSVNRYLLHRWQREKCPRDERKYRRQYLIFERDQFYHLTESTPNWSCDADGWFIARGKSSTKEKQQSGEGAFTLRYIMQPCCIDHNASGRRIDSAQNGEVGCEWYECCKITGYSWTWTRLKNVYYFISIIKRRKLANTMSHKFSEDV